MTRMLVAGALATMLVIMLGPMFIAWLRRNEFGQEVREDGPQSHIATKSGTPTMGGLLIFTAATLPFLMLGRHTGYGATVLIITLACALIGFWDDWTKITNRRSLGLSGRVKMGLLGLVTVGFAVAGEQWLGLPTTLSIPLTDWTPDLGPAYWGVVFLVIAGTANAVNLTDGIDGLAAGTVTLSLMTFVGISFILWERQLGDIGRAGSIDLAIFGASLAGACVGFLWWNAHPASIFMGDTGSMGLGGALAAFAVITRNELLLIVIGGLFVVEALSVIMQVISFKRWQRRIFLMTPIHHHFELKEWSETQIMVRFYIVAGLLAATGFTIWFRSH